MIAQLTATLLSEARWQDRYASVTVIVRTFLANLMPRGQKLSTTDLVEALMPVTRCRGEQITARNLLFKALMKIADHSLADCCTREEPKKGKFGQMQRPIKWHAPVDLDAPKRAAVLMLLDEVATADAGTAELEDMATRIMAVFK